MTNDIQVYILRWTNRPVHPKYVETIKQPYWKLDDRLASLNVVVHGNDSIDYETMECVCSEPFDHIRLIDARGKTDGVTQGQVALEAHMTAQVDDCMAYCIMDDDALMGHPHHTLSKIREALIDRAEGATGPFDNYRQFSKYLDREPDLEYQEMVWSPWTTTGIQCYNARAMQHIQQHVHDILSKVKSNTDYPLWLLLQLFGYRTTEFYDPSFKHACSNGEGARKDQDWYRKRILDAVHNYDVIRAKFIELEADPLYLKRIDTILRNRIKRSIKDGQGIYSSDWNIPLLKHYDELYAYIAKYLGDGYVSPYASTLKGHFTIVN